ncbi:cytochrome b561 and DOMON domain-containing protein At3g07570 [Diospyros lotus]|uniref:cytochrome b561 and DOMON domain-containing protein At3g07570 n=1 Tax=Diospyros lotus TaxID=55363 RepID=UPI0022505DC8|nr:cytochrome b561 and DOMON domain-containing protein At3g07570 [Diospyros lotus]
MKASFSIFIAFFLISASLSSWGVSSQADSCSSNLNLNGKIPFDTSSLICNPVWASQDFILRYSQAGPNLWSFVLSAPNNNAYISIGFSPNGNMVGSSAVVGWQSSDGTAGIKQYSLDGQTPSSVQPDKGKLAIPGNSSSVISSSTRVYVAFQLQTAQPETRLIYAVGPTGVFPSAPGDNRLAEHSDRATTTINYVTGKSDTKKIPYSNLRKSHGILGMVGWGILMPIGVIVARYFKQLDPIWFYSHVSIQTLGFIFGVAGIVSGIVLEDKTSASVNKHKGLGIFILVLGCLQVTAMLARPNKTSEYRKYWNWYHFTIGRLVIIFAMVNIFYGIDLANGGAGWNGGYAGVLVLLFIVATILEIKIWMKK